MPARPIDLTNCDKEPIHIPGSIQPHGFLLVLRASDLSIVQASENLARHCGIQPGDVMGRGLDHVLAPPDAGRISASLRRQPDGASPAYLFTVQDRQGNRFDSIGHRIGDQCILEFEPAVGGSEVSTPSLYAMTQSAILRLQRADSLNGAYAACAEEVRRIAGFDRVMVYRFDADWNGSVLAEDKRSDLEPFLGLHYPASDIPVQARELYRRNTLRFIADRNYRPARLVAAGGAPQEPLDMSLSVLRSVSPIHLEYLGNMGVAASMSISLLQGDQLWGLIACHHYTPRQVPFDVRTACELLARVLSLELPGGEDRELREYVAGLREARQAFVSILKENDSVEVGIATGLESLKSIFDCSGAAAVVDGRVLRIGQTPGPDDILQLCEWLPDHETDGVYATDHLGSEVKIGTLSLVSAGLLSLSVTPLRRVQLMWFRPEQIRLVHWAGDPNKSVNKGDAGVRLSPRGSFALWKQTVRGRSAAWSEAELAAAEELRQEISTILLFRAERLAQENQSLRQADEAKGRELLTERAARESAEKLSRMKDEFVATLSHELRTPLNAILGYAQLLRRGRMDAEEAEETASIIERNARVQSQMIEDLLDMSRITSGKVRLAVQPVNLASVIDAAIATVKPAANAKNIKLRSMLDPLQGVDVSGDPDRLQQVFWNLLSNAVKFTPRGGHVQVVLERVASHVEASVSDTGQGISPAFLPHVFDRFRQEDAAQTRRHGGLGLGLAIVRHLVELHGGTIHADSAGDGKGSTFTVSLPMRIMKRRQAPTRDEQDADQREPDYTSIDLSGVRILVLDDEPDARELVRRVLIECRAVIAVAGSVAEAIELVARQSFDVVISDVGMPVEDGYAMIAKLRRLETELGRTRTPAVALTAYARPEDRSKLMLAGFQVHIAKPVESSELVAVVASLSGRI